MNYSEKFKNIPLDVLHIILTLSKAGYKAYLAGGCVRDALMDYPINDYDIATDALPEQVLNIFTDSKLVGKAFGVCLVDGIEVATFRKDMGIFNGRHPKSVVYTTKVKEDAQRRDFTINAMYWDVINKKLLDLDPYPCYQSGIKDIENKCLRFVNNPYERIKEDYLRILRAIRFAAKYKLFLCNYEEIMHSAEKINLLAKERILIELIKILIHSTRSHALILMQQTNILDVLLPEIIITMKTEQPKEYHPEGDVFTHTYLTLQNLPDEVSPELAFAALLHDVGKPSTFTQDETGIHFYGHDEAGAKITNDIMHRLKANNNLIDRVTEMVANHMKFRFAKKMKKSKLLRFINRPTFSDELILHKADCMASNKNLENYDFIVKFIEENKNAPTLEKIKTIINGYDLITLGLTPGPVFRIILEAVQDAVLEGTIKTKEEAIQFVKGKTNAFTNNIKS